MSTSSLGFGDKDAEEQPRVPQARLEEYVDAEKVEAFKRDVRAFVRVMIERRYEALRIEEERKKSEKTECE